MTEGYVWIEISPGRKRQYKISDLERRPIKYGEAPMVISDEIDAVEGADGRWYESRSSLEAAAKREGCYTYSKQELASHIEGKKKEKQQKQRDTERKIKETAAKVANDYHLSNKL